MCLAFNMRVIFKIDFNNKDIGPNKFHSKKLDFRILLESKLTTREIIDLTY